jgi:hypothetical protein
MANNAVWVSLKREDGVYIWVNARKAWLIEPGVPGNSRIVFGDKQNVTVVGEPGAIARELSPP